MPWLKSAAAGIETQRLLGQQSGCPDVNVLRCPAMPQSIA